MIFIDRVRVHVKAGDGGRGCMSFRREKYVPRGGPDGGDGGRGGDITFVGHEGLTTLEELHARPSYRAGRGKHGEGKNRTGSDGKSIVRSVPPGTVVYRLPEKAVMGEILAHGEQLTVAKGGDGGRGNARFASSRNQAPRRAEPGRPGEEWDLLVELKVLADVGLVGFPNAGKSTLINSMCRTRSKVAGYPFTTLHPVVGTITYRTGERLLVADIPGLVERASRGAGLGFDFLRHIERTRVLLYVIDASPGASPAASTAIPSLFEEIRAYNPSILERPRVVALNKIDLIPGGRPEPNLQRTIEDQNRHLGGKYWIEGVSAKTGEGRETLIKTLREAYRSVSEEQGC